MIERLLRKEMTLRLKFLEECEKRDQAETRASQAFAELQEAKRELFRAGFKGNIMRGIGTLEELKAANPHDFTRCDELETSSSIDGTPLVTRQNAEEVIAAKDARIAELEDERYKLALAITGGEDAPGYLDSLTVETLVDVALDNTRRWFTETDRAKTLEADNKRLREALADTLTADLPFRRDDIKRGLILFRTSNNAHGYTNFVSLSAKVDALPQIAKDELANLMRSIANGLSPATEGRASTNDYCSYDEAIENIAAKDARIAELETEVENGGRVNGVNAQYANALAYLGMTEDDDPEEFAKRIWDEREALEADNKRLRKAAKFNELEKRSR